MFLYICSKKKKNHTTTIKVQADQAPYFFMINLQKLVGPSSFDTGGQCCPENVNPHSRMGGCLAPLEVEQGAGEMAQWVRAQTALPKVLSSNPSNHMVAHNHP
jgi:hypothetical protein